MSDLKYKLEPHSELSPIGTPLYRLRALRPLPGVPAGALGGIVSGPDNLTQWGDCWVEENAIVMGEDVHIAGNVRIKQYARVYGFVDLHDDVVVGEQSVLSGTVSLSGKSVVPARTTIVHAQIQRARQFVRNGNTYFAFRYKMDLVQRGRGLDFAMELSAADCSLKMARDLALLNEGEMLSYVQDVQGVVHPIDTSRGVFDFNATLAKLD